MRAWTEAVAIEMEKKEETWDGKEAGSAALTHRERRVEGGTISDVRGWVGEIIYHSLNGLVQENEQAWEEDKSWPCSGHA